MTDMQATLAIIVLAGLGAGALGHALVEGAILLARKRGWIKKSEIVVRHVHEFVPDSAPQDEKEQGE